VPTLDGRQIPVDWDLAAFLVLLAVHEGPGIWSLAGLRYLRTRRSEHADVCPQALTGSGSYGHSTGRGTYFPLMHDERAAVTPVDAGP
jgi:hypothetical protein